jgi:hypothetical protein
MENHLVYCLKCREHTHNNEIDVMPSKTNKKLLMLKSKCGQCGRGKNKWISRPHPQNGEGLQDIIDGIRRFFSGPRRDKAPPSVRKILETEGNQKIVSLSVNRDPINSVLKKIVDLVSLKMPHDKLFHLYIILKLENGKSYLLEKNQVIKMIPSTKTGQESMNIPINKDLKLGEFFINGQKNVGDEKFFVYDAIKANCQDFVMALLKGNNLGDKSVFDFVKQDTQGLVSGFMASIGKKITDVASSVDRALEGEGTQQKMIIKF